MELISDIRGNIEGSRPPVSNTGNQKGDGSYIIAHIREDVNRKHTKKRGSKNHEGYSTDGSCGDHRENCADADGGGRQNIERDRQTGAQLDAVPEGTTGDK